MSKEKIEKFFVFAIDYINFALDIMYTNNISHIKTEEDRYYKYQKLVHIILDKYKLIGFDESILYNIFSRGLVQIFEHSDNTGKLSMIILKDPTFFQILVAMIEYKKGLENKLKKVVVNLSTIKYKNEDTNLLLLGVIFSYNESWTDKLTSTINAALVLASKCLEIDKYLIKTGFLLDPLLNIRCENINYESFLPKRPNKYDQEVKVKSVSHSNRIIKLIKQQHLDYIYEFDLLNLVRAYMWATSILNNSKCHLNLVNLIHSAPRTEPLYVRSFMKTNRIKNFIQGDIIEYPHILSTTYATDNFSKFTMFLDYDEFSSKKIYEQNRENIKLKILDLFYKHDISNELTTRINYSSELNNKIDESLKTKELLDFSNELTPRINYSSELNNKIDESLKTKELLDFSNDISKLSKIIMELDELKTYSKIAKYIKLHKNEFTEENIKKYQTFRKTICCIGCITIFDYLILDHILKFEIGSELEIMLPPSKFRVEKVFVKSVQIKNKFLRFKHLHLIQLPDSYKVSNVTYYEL